MYLYSLIVVLSSLMFLWCHTLLSHTPNDHNSLLCIAYLYLLLTVMYLMFIVYMYRLTIHTCLNVPVFSSFFCRVCATTCVICVLCSAASVLVDHSVPQGYAYHITSAADPCNIYVHFLCEQYHQSPALSDEQIRPLLTLFSTHVQYNSVPQCVILQYCISVVEHCSFTHTSFSPTY